MKSFFTFVLLGLAVVLGSFGFFVSLGEQSGRSATSSSSVSQSHQLVMYSLTTCGYCTIKRQELQRAGIPFTEYFIDKDISARQRLNEKLQKAGIQGGSIGTPLFEVNGQMITGNPPFQKLQTYL